MKYWINRFWPKRKILLVLCFLVLYALVITCLRCVDTVMYDADMRRAGAVFALTTKVELWTAYELVFGAYPMYPGAELVKFIDDGSTALQIVLPVLFGVLGLQIYADDIRGGMISVVFARMRKSRYYLILGFGYLLSVVLIIAFFLAIQFIFAVIAAGILPSFGIIVSEDPIPWTDVAGSFFRWCILNASFALVSFQLAILFGRLRIVSQLFFLAVHWAVDIMGFSIFLCGPADMACIDNALNHPSMKVFWGWIILSVLISAVLAGVKWVSSATLPEEKVNEALL